MCLGPYFHYVRDPWGSDYEYSCDIDSVPADEEWYCGSHGVENNLCLWGSEPPPDFTFNYEASPEAQPVARR